ncbi:TetR/AcrR family transcriptional regulator [Bacillus massilinigeriensis]|uniref:TetR/AcrR family transcriptional regulator n=1 Tax=Bacillus massilionigeriensis TaxID=1805475 RepID=UPI00096AF242|nr:TetR/AcrR family transcriptional regulator [Bacillus massilionigeriensis]
MNDRKQHVIEVAHQLFLDKGFQATSIQDILDYSGISKGTFYNYFSSKNELLKELFKTIFIKLEKDRNELLIGQDPSNIEIFIKQIELQMKTNRKKMVVPLFEEITSSNDADLKEFIRKGQLRMLRWLNTRFMDIFGQDKAPYLLDISIMFLGILHHTLRYYSLAYSPHTNIHKVIRYCVERMVKMVDEVSEAKAQLIEPQLLDSWLPELKKKEYILKKEVSQSVSALKKMLKSEDEQAKYFELLDFIQDEIFNSKMPRKFLIESAILTLVASITDPEWRKGINILQKHIKEYYIQLDEE